MIRTVKGMRNLDAPVIIDVTDTEAFLVRKDGDGGDVFIVDTTNACVGIGTAPISGCKLVFPTEDDPSTPTIAFGDGDTGIYEAGANQLGITLNGSIRFFIAADEFRGAGVATPSLLNATASATNPVHVFRDDGDTGIGRAAADQLSLIAGGEEGIRLVQDTWGCSLHIPEITTPTAITNFGALYTKSDNALYFQDGAGVEHTVTIS